MEKLDLEMGIFPLFLGKIGHFQNFLLAEITPLRLKWETPSRSSHTIGKGPFHMKPTRPVLRMLTLLCGAALLLGVLLPRSGPAAADDTYAASEGTVVGYYAGWAAYWGCTPDQLPAQQLTHINYAFAGIDPDTGTLALGDPDLDLRNLAALRALREEHPHLKLLISVGGWDASAYFSDAASTAARRAAFAQSCVDFLVEQELDGIDLDWEYPVSGGLPGTIHRPQDGKNFTLLLQALRTQLDRQGRRDGKRYYLTIAGAAGSDYLGKIEPKAVAELVDHVFLMAYDIHGPWDRYADFNAPLYTPSEASPQYQNSVYDSIQRYLQQGVPADKLVLGMPLYGYCYQGAGSQNNGLYSRYTSASSVPYRTLVSRYLNDSSYRQLRHEEAQVPYLYGNGSFVTYEDPQSMAAKGSLAREEGLGGIGFWEISQDSGSVLVESAVEAFTGGDAPETPEADGSGGFLDVSPEDWFFDVVAYVAQRGWMTGTSASQFSPQRSTSRGMLVTILHRLSGAPEAPAAPFSDLEAGAYYQEAVAWAAAEGIVEGYGGGRFGPDDAVTREQTAAILFRFAAWQGRDTSERAGLENFQDGNQVSPYAREAVAWAVAQGLLTGRTEDILAPGGTASRAETAALLARFAPEEDAA